MITGSINGSPLVAVPATPGPRMVEWKSRNKAGALDNPFTFKQQIQDWQAGMREATVTMPAMNRASAAAWVAFLEQLRGQVGVFLFGDGLATEPLGTAEGMGLVSGVFQAPFLLTTNGWTPNQPMLLQPGDLIQVGYRLYRNLNLAASDGAGNASIAISPNIREQPAAGTPIVTSNPQGLFRLATNDPGWSQNYDRTWRLSFPIREAI